MAKGNNGKGGGGNAHDRAMFRAKEGNPERTAPTGSSLLVLPKAGSHLNLPNQKKSHSLFLFIISLLGGVVMTLLQLNHVNVNWVLSAVIYAACTIIAALSVWFFAAPHLSRSKKGVLAAIALIPFGALGIWGTNEQFKRDHQATLSRNSHSVPQQSKRPPALFGGGKNVHLIFNGITVEDTTPSNGAIGVRTGDNSPVTVKNGGKIEGFDNGVQTGNDSPVDVSGKGSEIKVPPR